MGDDPLLGLSGYGADGRRGLALRSQFSVGDFSALRAVGFEPLGPVVGASFQHFPRMPVVCTPRGFNQTSTLARRRWGRMASTVTSGTNWDVNSDDYVKALYRARMAATRHIAAECARLGADGVVAVSLRFRSFLDHSRTLGLEMAGTAVRAQGKVRPVRPFLCHLPGVDFATLVSSGWVPVDLAWGISVGIRHEDQATRRSTRRFTSNAFRGREVPAWTELVTATRQEARSLLRLDAARAGADGTVLSHTEMKIGKQSCPSHFGAHDRLVECTLLGTAIASFGSLPSRRPSTTLQL